MAGRNDAAIAVALQAMAQAVGQQPNAGAGGNDGVRTLETFMRNHPPTFKGRYDPDGVRHGSKKLREFFESCNALKLRWYVLVHICSLRRLMIGG